MAATTSRCDLRPYVQRRDFGRLVSPFKNIRVKDIVAGLNGNRENGNIDGEPHFVLFLNNSIATIDELESLCASVGQHITTNRRYFPYGINTSLVVERERVEGAQLVFACTFERGVEYVTRACGTAAALIGSYLLSQQTDLHAVNVRMPGGTLIIESDEQKRYYMTGPANPIT